jgi:preprotein translocase subunit SecG
MGETWGRGWRLIVHSLNVFKAYPTFLVPILAVWTLYAPAVLYLRYGYRWNAHSPAIDLAVVFLFIFALSFCILMSCAVVLDMIRQIESGAPSLSKAVAKAFGQDMVRLLPLAAVWALVWFALTLVEAIFSKKDSSENETLTAQHAAETIANYRDFSFSGAFIDALKKGVRMVVFLIMPAIVWENLDFYAATKKGLAVLRAHLSDFGAGYALTYAAAAVVFLPPAIILELGTGRHGNPPIAHFPDSVWAATIIYMGLAWSFSIYLEQMFMAQLYLWHMTWEESVSRAKLTHQPAPAFDEVARPELLAKTPGLFAPSPA